MQRDKKMKKDLSTEQKIKDAARKVFMTKGFSGCTTREIAKSVGINVVAAKDKAALIKRLEECDDQDYFERGIELAIEDTVISNHELETQAATKSGVAGNPCST